MHSDNSSHGIHAAITASAMWMRCVVMLLQSMCVDNQHLIVRPDKMHHDHLVALMHIRLYAQKR